MPLPANFREWDHLRSVLIKTHNRDVREEFADLGGGDWDASISTSRGSLRVACTIKATDSAITVCLRFFLYYFLLRKASDLQAPLYGIPVGIYHQTRKFRPQVRLYFREDLNDVEEGYRPISAEITFRLMNETTETITRAQLTTLATRIKNGFATGNGYRWFKGKVLMSYNDPERGYKIQLYAFNETGGKDVIAKVLGIQNHTPDWKNLTINENSEPTQAYPTIPPLQTIVGKSVRMPRKRPSGYVRFQHATCAIWV